MWNPEFIWEYISVYGGNISKIATNNKPRLPNQPVGFYRISNRLGKKKQTKKTVSIVAFFPSSMFSKSPSYERVGPWRGWTNDHQLHRKLSWEKWPWFFTGSRSEFIWFLSWNTFKEKTRGPGTMTMFIQIPWECQGLTFRRLISVSGIIQNDIKWFQKLGNKTATESLS